MTEGRAPGVTVAGGLVAPPPLAPAAAAAGDILPLATTPLADGGTSTVTRGDEPRLATVAYDTPVSRPDLGLDGLLLPAVGVPEFDRGRTGVMGLKGEDGTYADPAKPRNAASASGDRASLAPPAIAAAPSGAGRGFADVEAAAVTVSPGAPLAAAVPGGRGGARDGTGMASLPLPTAGEVLPVEEIPFTPAGPTDMAEGDIMIGSRGLRAALGEAGPGELSGLESGESAAASF